MVKFINNIKDSLKLYRRQQILRVNLFQGQNFYLNFDIKFNNENLLTSALLKQDLIQESHNMVLNSEGLQFSKDLEIVEQEFKDLQELQITPGLVVYDDQEKKIHIYNKLMKKHDVKLGVFIGEVSIPIYAPQEELTLTAKSVLLNDLYKLRFLQLVFVFGGTLFLTQAQYDPERCTEGVIASKDQLQKLIKTQ